MKFEEYIRKSRELAGISQAKAAELAGVTRENYNSFENCRKPLKDEGLVSLAPHIGLNPETILFQKTLFNNPKLFPGREFEIRQSIDGKGNKWLNYSGPANLEKLKEIVDGEFPEISDNTNRVKSNDLRSVDISLGKTQARLLGTVTGGPFTEKEGDEHDYIDVPFDVDTDTVAFEVVGDSMHPVIQDGQKVLATRVRPNKFINGEMYIVVTNEWEATCKTLLKKGNKWMLTPENPDFEAIPIKMDDVRRVFVIEAILRR